jgi:Secretion system C-terminal sorting domain
MKKYSILLLLAMLSAASICAQSYHTVYPSGFSGYSNYFYSITPVENIPATPLGYISAGETRTSSGPMYRYPCVIRTDKNGLLTQPVNFKRLYILFDLTGTYRQGYAVGAFPMIDGQTVVVGNYYDLSGGNIEGIYWQLLNADGSVAGTTFYKYTFRGQAVKVIQSAYGGNLYVCGQSYDPFHNSSRVSVMNIDPWGNLVWSKMYDIGGNSPTDNDEAVGICELPYGPTGNVELVVAGKSYFNDAVRGQVARIFAQRMNPADGSLHAAPVLYDALADNMFRVEHIQAVTDASFGVGVLFTGAFIRNSGIQSEAWAMLTDNSISNVLWTNYYVPASSSSMYEINRASAQLTDVLGNNYFALCGNNTTVAGSWNGHVIKVDLNGNPTVSAWNNYGGAWDEVFASATHAAGSTTTMAMAGNSQIGTDIHGWIAHTNSSLAVPCSYLTDNCSANKANCSKTTTTYSDKDDAVKQNASSWPIDWFVPYPICYSAVRLADVAVEADDMIAENNNSVFSIFPNPASNQVAVNIDKLDENAKLIITDISGREVLSRQISSSETEQTIRIDFDGLLAKGLYTVTLQTSIKTKTELLIIQ